MSNPTIIRFPPRVRLVNTDFTAKPLVKPMATPAVKPPKLMSWWRKWIQSRGR